MSHSILWKMRKKWRQRQRGRERPHAIPGLEWEFGKVRSGSAVVRGHPFMTSSLRGEEVGLNKDDNTDRLGDRNSDKGRVSKIMKLCGHTLWTGLNAQQQQLGRKGGRSRRRERKRMCARCQEWK